MMKTIEKLPEWLEGASVTQFGEFVVVSHPNHPPLLVNKKDGSIMSLEVNLVSKNTGLYQNIFTVATNAS